MLRNAIINHYKSDNFISADALSLDVWNLLQLYGYDDITIANALYMAYWKSLVDFSAYKVSMLSFSDVHLCYNMKIVYEFTGLKIGKHMDNEVYSHGLIRDCIECFNNLCDLVKEKGYHSDEIDIA